ncbi:uncharacterized protein LOC111042231 [Myzus persicae]|uniref:uncharacterized protein LOC111042231 n=1 Tax=Myzus persicae TaxID=13164 RepID=UPI000B9341F7|nr:uncharacterized protein LOC111042231 [Myzus persicae]
MGRVQLHHRTIVALLAGWQCVIWCNLRAPVFVFFVYVFGSMFMAFMHYCVVDKASGLCSSVSCTHTVVNRPCKYFLNCASSVNVDFEAFSNFVGTAIKMSGDPEASNSLPATINIEKPTSQEADANSVANSGDTATVSNQYISLRVINRDLFNELKYRLKPTTSLVRLKRSYSNKLGTNVHRLRFMFNGYRIIDDDTPEKLGMVNGDDIEICYEINGYHMKRNICKQ